MSVTALYRFPRMGPVFGGMLLSGRRVAEIIAAKLKNQLSMLKTQIGYNISFK